MRALGRVLLALVLVALVAGVVAVGLAALYGYNKMPLPLQDQCVARVADRDVGLDVEQTHNASIIVGVATRRGLVPRASTIALATVYQESGVRNIDYGDRDSLGLFQQRPSQGWGTPDQVQDPYYAAGKFYDVLVTVPGWEDGDVNDVAQAVQRSGHPNGYARHVENARRLASSLTGETPASFSCVVRTPPPGDPAGLAAFLEQTLPDAVRVTAASDRVTLDARSNRGAWSAAHIAIAQTAFHGVSRVEVGEASWTLDRRSVAGWEGTDAEATRAVVFFDNLPSPTPTP